MAKAKIPGTIYTLIFQRVSDSEFKLSLEFRGNIETSAKIPELDDELVVQAALRMIEEFRIPASEPGIRSLASKLTSRFSRKQKKSQATERTVTPPVSKELEEMVRKTPVSPKTVPPDSELADLVAKLDAIKGEDDFQEVEHETIIAKSPVQEVERAAIDAEPLPDMSSEVKKVIDRVSRFITPMQDDVRQISRRIAELETRLPDEGRIATLEKKIQTLEPILEKINTLEAVIQRIEAQITHEKLPDEVSSVRNAEPAVQHGPAPPGGMAQMDSDALSHSITRSAGFQDLKDFSEQLDKEHPPLLEEPEIIENIIKYARGLWKDGRRQQAIQVLEDASHDHQTDPELLLLLGNFHSHRGHIHEAVESYDRALSFFPDNPRVLLALGEAYMTLDLNENAIDYLKRAQALKPDDADIRAKLSNAYMRAGQQAAAMEELKSFVDSSSSPETIEADVGHSSAPLSLAALKRADLDLMAARERQEQASQREETAATRQEIDKK
ncbi:MAG: tetratricopeptide repeat protein, partial [Candidatus Hodarchaeota archaeon]